MATAIRCLRRAVRYLLGMLLCIVGPGRAGCLWKRGEVLRSRPANNRYDQTVGETGIHLVPERFTIRCVPLLFPLVNEPLYTWPVCTVVCSSGVAACAIGNRAYLILFSVFPFHRWLNISSNFLISM